jgi:dTDP-4-amino-4,6-dideoxygalactose transaminase
MSDELAVHGGTPVRTTPFASWPVFDEAEEQALLRVLRSRRWGRHGEGEIERVEQRFAARHGARFGLVVANGTVALRIALLAMEIEAGDEVIVPPYTFLATATAVVEANATPIFVDIEDETFNLDPRLIEAAITPRTRAIIPVHMAGLPADMEAITAIARRHKLRVIEDAAHAHGGLCQGRPVGSWGDLACFSFQSSKNLNSGEGGAVLTSDERLYERAKSVHNCGRLPEGAWYEHHIISGNYRLTEFQAALLNTQMDRLDAQFARRLENGDYLARRLAEVPGIRPQRCTLPQTQNAYHLLLFHFDPAVYGPKAGFLTALRAEGVPVSEGYLLPLHQQPLFRDKAFGPYTGYRSARPDVDFAAMSCPVAERACTADAAWLYQSVLLGTQQDLDDIVTAFEKVYRHRARLPR